MTSIIRIFLVIKNYNSLSTTCLQALKHYLTSLNDVIYSYGFKYTSVNEGFHIIFSHLLDPNHYPVLKSKLQFCIPEVQYDEGVDSDQNPQLLSYFPDPLLRPTLCYTHEPTNTNISIIQTSLRELTQLQKPVKCLAVFNLGIPCNPVVWAGDYCKRHFEAVYNAMKMAVQLPPPQQEQIYKFCKEYLATCLHPLKNLMMVTVLLKFPKIMLRDPNRYELSEISKSLVHFDNHYYNYYYNLKVLLVLYPLVNINIYVAGLLYKHEWLETSKLHVEKAEKILENFPMSLEKTRLLKSTARFLDVIAPRSDDKKSEDTIQQTLRREEKIVLADIVAVLSEMEMTVQPLSWSSPVSINLSSTPVLDSSMARLTSLHSVSSTTHCVTVVCSDDQEDEDSVVRVHLIENEMFEEPLPESFHRPTLDCIQEEDENESEDEVTNVFLSKPSVVQDIEDSDAEDVPTVQEISRDNFGEAQCSIKIDNIIDSIDSMIKITKKAIEDGMNRTSLNTNSSRTSNKSVLQSVENKSVNVQKSLMDKWMDRNSVIVDVDSDSSDDENQIVIPS